MISVKSPRPLEYVLLPPPPLSSTPFVPLSFAPSPPCTCSQGCTYFLQLSYCPFTSSPPHPTRVPFHPRVYALISALLPCLTPPAPPSTAQVYAPSRTVVVYAPADFADKDADRKPHGIPGLGIKELGPYFSR